jgi:serralysin
MPANETYYCVCMTTDTQSSSADQARLKHHKAAVLNAARWDLGASISVRFLGEDGGLQRRVQDVAMEWTKIANLDFDFRATGPTDIRVAFQPGAGSWSYLGTMCRQIEEPKPTMNYGWLTTASPDSEVRRVVLHEFGHAIGLIHEHQNPKHGISWNRPAVIHDLSGPPNNWNEATIDNNMFRFYPPGDVMATDVDPLSIMMYPIPKAWTLDGFSAGMNSELSSDDKELIRNAYPGRL